MPPFIVRPKEKSKDPNDYSEHNSTPQRPELTVLNLDVNPLKTETISIKGHENDSAQNSHHSHDLTYQSFCKIHVSHGNVVLLLITETNSRGLDAFKVNCWISGAGTRGTHRSDECYCVASIGLATEKHQWVSNGSISLWSYK
jgi:hypothetical protein